MTQLTLHLKDDLDVETELVSYPYTRMRYDNHVLTLLAVRGYVGEIELDSLVSLDNGVTVFRCKKQTVYVTSYTVNRYNNEESVEDVRIRIQMLWASSNEKTEENCAYWLIFDSDKISSVESDSPAMPLSNELLDTLSNDPKVDQTIGIPEFDPKLEATRILEKELGIDILWADIIRQAILRRVSEIVETKKVSRIKFSAFLSRAEIRAIISNVLSFRDKNKQKGYSDVNVVTFPPMLKNDVLYEGMSIRPAHISSGQLVRRPDLVENVLTKLERVGSCVITSDTHNLESALLWSIVDETEDQRCWFHITSYACLNSFAILALIASYNYRYPIGFIIEDINLESSRLYLKMVDAARGNENIWILGTTLKTRQYLVSAHIDVAIEELKPYKTLTKLDSNLPEQISDEIPKTDTEPNKLLDYRFFSILNSSKEEEIGNDLIWDSITNFVRDRYTITNRNNKLHRSQSFAVNQSTFRTSKKSQKQKPKRKHVALKKRPNNSPDNQTKIRTPEEQRLFQERVEELDVLITTAYLTALGGNIKVEKLQCLLNFPEEKLLSTIRRLQRIGTLILDSRDKTIYGVSILASRHICFALVDENFATWKDLTSSAIVFADSNILEQLLSQIIHEKYLDRTEITKAIQDRFEKQKANLDNSNIDIHDREITEFEDYIRCARGISHGSILRITDEELKIEGLLKIDARHFIPEVHKIITGLDKSGLFDDNPRNIPKQAKKWHNRVRSISFPQTVTSTIIEWLCVKIEQFDPKIICSALHSLIGLRLETKYVAKLRKLHSKIPDVFKSLSIGDIADILDCLKCISKETAQQWILAYDAIQDYPTLITRIIEETPNAIPIYEYDDGPGVCICAPFALDEQFNSRYHNQELVNRHSNAVKIFSLSSYDVVSRFEFDKQEIDAMPYRVAFDNQATLAMEKHSIESIIPVNRFLGSPSWSDYLNEGFELLTSSYDQSIKILDLISRQKDRTDALNTLHKTNVDAVMLVAPAELDWFDYDNNQKFRRMQNFLPLLNKEFIEAFSHIPNSDLFFNIQLSRIRVLCKHCYKEPWKHIFAKPPSVLRKMDKLLKDMKVVSLASENIQMSPFERWSVPKGMTNGAFSYIVKKSRRMLTADQRIGLKSNDPFLV